MTRKDIVREYGISKGTLYAYIRSNGFPSHEYQDGNRNLIYSRDKVVKWFADPTNREFKPPLARGPEEVFDLKASLKFLMTKYLNESSYPTIFRNRKRLPKTERKTIHLVSDWNLDNPKRGKKHD